MFGATKTPEYFTRLLRFDERYLQLIVSSVYEAFVIHTQSSSSIFNRPDAILDYKLQDYGSVVPQSTWTPATPGGALRRNSSLKMPIFFVQGCKTLGIGLVQAAAGICTGLLDARALAPIGFAHTIFIRVNVSISEVSDGGAIVNGVYF